MADNFGLKIGVEGEKEFKKALAEINQTFKVLGSEMNLVASQFDKQDKSVEALSARNRVLNQEIDTQRQKISTLQQALETPQTPSGKMTGAPSNGKPSSIMRRPPSMRWSGSWRIITGPWRKPETPWTMQATKPTILGTPL